jgi:hypothetical protein
MKKYLLLAMLLTLVAYAVPTYAADPGEGSVSILFVQTSKGVAFDKGTMTLKGVSPSTVFFSDRPNRIAGHLPTSHFLKVWDEGKDNFKNDPPNANVTILGKTEGATNVVLELSNPRLKGEDLIYDVQVLDGTPPATGDATAVFIDWWVSPGGMVCHRNWYTGQAWCHWPGPYYYPRYY